MIHELKTDPEAFDAVANGTKTFEIRKSDRPFARLDVLHLRRTYYSGQQMAEGAPLEYNGPEAKPALAGAAGSARKCEWLIGRGRLSALCPCEATRIDPSTGSVFCESHAEDYEDVFGDVLHTLSPNATGSATPKEGGPNGS